MAFDTKRPHGTSLGGVTHGFKVQDGKMYDHGNVEVDPVTGVQLAQKQVNKGKTLKVEAPKPKTEAEVELENQGAI